MDEQHQINHDNLTKAYNDPNGVYVSGDTMYIAGTRSFKDVKQWYLIPTVRVNESTIYKRTSQMLNIYPDTKNLVAHSYGSSVALQIEKEQPGRFNTMVYSAPVISNRSGQRFSKRYDPVSLLDFKKSYISGYGHGY